MLVVKVATKKPVKLEAIQAAFERFFEDAVEVFGVEVDSGVPEQPMNDEVFIGAENRIIALKQVCGDYDYLVSCEGGIINQYGYWINTQVILVENKEGDRGLGMSQGYQVPDSYIEDIRKTSIARVFDKLFGRKKGGLRFLSNGQFNRRNLIESGVIMALTRFNW